MREGRTSLNRKMLVQLSGVSLRTFAANTDLRTIKRLPFKTNKRNTDITPALCNPFFCRFGVNLALLENLPTRNSIVIVREKVL